MSLYDNSPAVCENLNNNPRFELKLRAYAKVVRSPPDFLAWFVHFFAGVET